MKEILNHTFKGEIEVPGDKSITHRAVMIGSVSEGITRIYSPLLSDDILMTIECMKQLGAHIEVKNDTIIIDHSNGIELKSPKETLYVGNSGTTIRLLSGLVAGLKIDATLTGDNSIENRPMKRIKDPLEQMGASINLKNDNYPPIHISKRELNNIDYDMPVASAQVKSAIIFAALNTKGITTIREKNISRNHTEIMLKDFGANINISNDTIFINSDGQLNGQTVRVPGDISSAAFLMVLAAIIPKSDITIKNVSLNPTRDGIIDVFKMIGADMTITSEKTTGEPYGSIRVKYKENLKPFVIGDSLIPKLIDEIPILTVLALFIDGKSVIKDAEELRVKETDRIKAVTTELEKFGANFNVYDSGYEIHPVKTLKKSDVQLKSYNDHRIVMMLIVMAIKMKQPLNIDSISSMGVSYPNFLDDLQTLKKEVDYE